ncbi:hypothetical protein M440DRAFT_1388116 [Trichoderma longibrachiatum ATCC 18648]|uniref:Uncharacterized protein n=1 Tax=Trichoderma longibrachiatum ATCC 18648 TaxID=983965 RepID=A0A2T4CJM6_TRILO|nr:hypothetical protein M440DRAFT_1388116 [Trichoderma longibrachiatum ATCC 18648]
MASSEEETRTPGQDGRSEKLQQRERTKALVRQRSSMANRRGANGKQNHKRARRRGGPNGESRRRSWIGRASKSRNAQNGEVEVGREKQLEEKIEVARGREADENEKVVKKHPRVVELV